MSESYTVRMKRKLIRTNYDAKGRCTGEAVTLLDEVYTDLPYMTAMGYQRNFPDAQVTIEKQAPGRAETRRVSSGKDFVRRTKIEGLESSAPKSSVKRTAPVREKATGDYSEVVNKMLEAE